MKNFLIIFFLISTTVFSQDFSDGMVAVEFNASFNEPNKVVWLPKLTDCKIERVDITADARWASEYKIVVVPTIIVFNEGKDVKRFQANIMMKLEVTQEEVQEKIEEIIMEDF